MTLKFTGQPSIFEEGYLTQLYTDVYNKRQPQKLSNHQLTRMATILGQLSHEYDLYNLLFEQPQQRLQVDRVEVNSRDLKSFVLMDHTFTRGWFSTPAQPRSATSDTTNSQGVPLALEGAKRQYNKTYMSWIPEATDKDALWKCDVFLPAELGSLQLDENENVVQCDKYGLLTLMINNIDFPTSAINQIRQQVPNYLTATKPRMVKHVEDVEENYGTIYNKCSQKLRSLILQGWVWSEACRNDDMIQNITDWDAPAIHIGYEGLQPNTTTELPPGLRT